ncbi:MAG TPA: sugar phosphate isomerase/epimerase [Candidatus Hydrogenedentes bacterium]|nr:sugar phosphate isomerase/epimerase [Candidatus Hydrogenedentota bacterium]HPG65957.1 sugar phosphate isomerase/epimerase [Candidatus Hydrogenedentota bacterium]
MASMNIALQLYTVREPAKQDLRGTLKRCREAGFEYVQWSGMPQATAEEIRNALDDAGLKAMACHIDTEDFERNYAEMVAYWKTVGALDVAPGGMMGDCRDSLDGWLAGAQRLDALGAKLRGDGMRLSYHNHASEFEKFPGDDRCKLDILYEHTSPENLFAELDTAWVQVGGADPAAYIQKYANRCPVIHVKDLASNQRDGRVWFTPLGEGVLDWDAILATSADCGVEWLVYEQDTCEGDPLDDVAISYRFLDSHVG